MRAKKPLDAAYPTVTLPVHHDTQVLHRGPQSVGVRAQLLAGCRRCSDPAAACCVTFSISPTARAICSMPRASSWELAAASSIRDRALAVLPTMERMASATSCTLPLPPRDMANDSSISVAVSFAAWALRFARPRRYTPDLSEAELRTASLPAPLTTECKRSPAGPASKKIGRAHV